ncbi:MAG: hypothetical protein SPE98_02705 [Bacteroidaceae bacterium]|nr:hypothetical protein [Bacteroidaceae bacterium]
MKDVAFLLKIENRYAQIISFVQKIVWDALRKIAHKGTSVQFLGFSDGFLPRGSHESVVWRAPLLGPLNICFPGCKYMQLRMQTFASAIANVCIPIFLLFSIGQMPFSVASVDFDAF